MRTESELSQIALDFVSDCTAPQSAFEYAADLETLGAHGAKIPKVRANDWIKVINALITDRKLHEVNGFILVVVEAVSDFEQLRLF
jgi:hypothetical protein